MLGLISTARMARRALALGVLVAALLTASPAMAAEGTYVPFVTDFPKPATAAEPFIPLVTDFPKPAAVASPSSDPLVAPVNPSDWSAFAIAAAVSAALGLSLVAARRARPVQV